MHRQVAMLGIYLSRITKLAALGGALSLLALPCVQAEEPRRPMPLLLEEGGNLNYFDPATMTLNIQGRPYRIDPASTRVVVISAQITELPAGQLGDLAERLDRLRGRPLSFQSGPDGRLELLVLDDARAGSSPAP
ncbi:MAG: hypothetical protein AB7U65_03855 [Halothiobacillaceae bacterium]